MVRETGGPQRRPWKKTSEGVSWRNVTHWDTKKGEREAADSGTFLVSELKNHHFPPATLPVPVSLPDSL